MTRPAVLITGAAKRVGSVTAQLFAQAGYDIGLHYHRSEDDAAALAQKLSAMGVRCELFHHDMGDTAGLPALIDRVKAAMPACNALINNASVFERASFMETDEALFDRQFGINFKSPFFLTQAFAKSMGKGSVVNLLGTDIGSHSVTHFAYLLSKKAFAEFTLMAARELGPKLRVNGVCPGIVLPSSDLDGAFMEKLATTLPMRQVATPEEVAQACLYLAQSATATGQLIYCDGGQHLL